MKPPRGPECSHCRVCLADDRSQVDRCSVRRNQRRGGLRDSRAARTGAPPRDDLAGSERSRFACFDFVRTSRSCMPFGTTGRSTDEFAVSATGTETLLAVWFSSRRGRRGRPSAESISSWTGRLLVSFAGGEATRRRADDRSSVLRRWQLAQRTSHSAISTRILAQLLPPFARVEMFPSFSPTWSNSRTTMSASPQSTQGWSERYATSSCWI